MMMGVESSGIFSGIWLTVDGGGQDGVGESGVFKIQKLTISIVWF